MAATALAGSQWQSSSPQTPGRPVFLSNFLRRTCAVEICWIHSSKHLTCHNCTTWSSEREPASHFTKEPKITTGLRVFPSSLFPQDILVGWHWFQDKSLRWAYKSLWEICCYSLNFYCKFLLNVLFSFLFFFRETDICWLCFIIRNCIFYQCNAKSLKMNFLQAVQFKRFSTQHYHPMCHVVLHLEWGSSLRGGWFALNRQHFHG